MQFSLLQDNFSLFFTMEFDKEIKRNDECISHFRFLAVVFANTASIQLVVNFIHVYFFYSQKENVNN